MSEIDTLMNAHERSIAAFPGHRPAPPRTAVAIVTCMDARIDVYRTFGLQVGDAHVLRNAGGLITDDVLRSLAISQHKLGTRSVVVVHHTECGMNGFDDATFRQELTEAADGAAPPWSVDGFTDLRGQVAASVQRVRTSAWLPHRDDVRGFVFDIGTGRLDEVR